MTEAMDEGSLAAKSKKKYSAMREKVIFSREEKEEFIAWLSTQFADASFRNAFMRTTALARARAVIRSAASKKNFTQANKSLDHAATFSDCIAGSVATLDGPHKASILKHFASLQNAAKGSLKIIKRREKLIKSASSSQSKKKAPKRHQSRHY